MELQYMLSARFFRNEILKDFEKSDLDPQYLKVIRENEEAYKAFHDLFGQLSGTTADRIRLINEVLEYLRDRPL